MDSNLSAYAVAFGAEVNRDSFAAMVSRVTEVLVKQVATGAHVDFPLSTYGTLQVTTPSGELVVQMLGGQSELRNIAVHREALYDEQLQPIVRVVLALLAHPSNNRANRLMLMSFLCDMRSRLTADQARSVFEVAYPLWVGSARASPTDLPSSRTTDRFQLNAPSQAEEEAYALGLIVSVCGPTFSDAEMGLSRLVLNGLRHPSPEVRQSACAAATELREWTPDLEAALMTAALDREWRVAGAALHTVTLLLQRGLLRRQIPLLTAVAAKSLATEKPLVRALAARLVHDLLQYSPTAQNRQLLEEMLETLAGDVSYQVRQAAKWGDATDVGDSVGDQD
jgi:hypothetical protein